MLGIPHMLIRPHLACLAVLIASPALAGSTFDFSADGQATARTAPAHGLRGASGRLWRAWIHGSAATAASRGPMGPQGPQGGPKGPEGPIFGMGGGGTVVFIATGWFLLRPDGFYCDRMVFISTGWFLFVFFQNKGRGRRFWALWGPRARSGGILGPFGALGPEPMRPGALGPEPMQPMQPMRPAALSNTSCQRCIPSSPAMSGCFGARSRPCARSPSGIDNRFITSATI